MGSEIEKQLFDIPAGIEFPMELAIHLKSKLHTAMEQTWHLKRHIDYLDKEVIELRKFKSEHHEEPSSAEMDRSLPASLMASKIVELSKKNRDMTAQIESMKTKMKKLMSQNEKHRSAQGVDMNNEDNQYNVDSVSSIKTDEGIVSSSQQLTQLTNKMMEYRRQCQQLKLDLRSALRALSQEVGEGVTPQSVLSMTSNNSWRGRQQQIMGLQQKLADLQIKLSNVQHQQADLSSLSYKKHGFHGTGDNRPNIETVDCIVKKSNSSSLLSEKAFSITSTSSMLSSVAPKNRNGLLQHDMRKQEQIAKLTHQVENMTQDLSSRQQDLKASKARIQTLESQTRSYRSQIDLLESRLMEKDTESKSSWSEMSQLKQELSGLKDREKRCRDKTGLEIQEANRALTRERAIVVRLQQVIAEKQEALQKSDGEMIELRNKLEMCCSSNVQGGINTIERIQDLEIQLCNLSDVISIGEKERQRLLEVMNGAISETEGERQKVVQAQRKSVKVFTVLQQADKCIDDCLDAAQITNTSLLQEVENIRTLMRELRAGELYSLNQETETGSVKKLRTKLGVLKTEVQVLQNSLQEQGAARKSDLNNYARLSEQTKRDLTTTFNETSHKRY